MQVDVFDSVKELRPLGVGINLLPHAVRELDALGLLDELSARSVAPAQLVYCTRRGQEIWREQRGLAAGYPLAPALPPSRRPAGDPAAGADRSRGCRTRSISGGRWCGSSRRTSHPVAVFEDGEVEADVLIAADGIHSVARAQRYPGEGPPLWNGSLLWRGVAEIEPVLDGRSMIWAGHPDQKFVGYPIADLPDGTAALQFHRGAAATGLGPGDTGGLEPQGVARRLPAAFRVLGLRLAGRPGHHRRGDGDLRLPHGRPGAVAPLDLRHGTTLLGDAAHPMYPIGSNGASQAILDARVLAGCLRRSPATTRPARSSATRRSRRPATAAIVQANRGLGPELPMRLVEERAPDGFADIADVITPAEIARVTEDYRRTAGFSLAALQRGVSLLEEPFPA